MVRYPGGSHLFIAMGRPSHRLDYVQRVLRSNALLTRLLVRLFESRFDPAKGSQLLTADGWKKVGGKWLSRTLYENAAARPKGYTGLTVSCASCHGKGDGASGPGTGGYAVGLTPGASSSTPKIPTAGAAPRCWKWCVNSTPWKMRRTSRSRC